MTLAPQAHVEPSAPLLQTRHKNVKASLIDLRRPAFPKTFPDRRFVANSDSEDTAR
jgi:hypothetical protein